LQYTFYGCIQSNTAARRPTPAPSVDVSVD
jgi:hypothetical protein